MGDPIKELHNTLTNEGLLSGAAADVAQFESNMSDPGKRKQLFDYLSKERPDMVDMEYADFDKQFAPPISKKKESIEPSGQPSSGSSSSPSAVPAPDAGMASTSEPAVAANAPNQLLRDYSSVAGPVPSKEPGRLEAPGMLTGKEDPIETGARFLARTEVDNGAKSRSADKYPWRKGQRELDQITLYGQKALEQSTAAEKQIGDRLGKDWQARMNNYANTLGPLMSGEVKPANQEQQDMLNEAVGFWNSVKSDPAYKVWENGQNALQRAQADFQDYGKKNPEYARLLASNKEAMAAADNSTFRSWQNWAGNKLTQIVGGIASLPRTVIGATTNPGSMAAPIRGTAVETWAKNLGDWADGAIEYAAAEYPTGSGTKRPLWEKMADFGGTKVVVDEQGQPVKAYRDNVEVAMDDKFTKAFIASGAAGQAENKFTGIKNSTMKLADVVSDIYVMRYLGGGSMAGTTAVAFGLQHQDAYNTAVKDLNLSGDDAATYAMISAGLSGVIEASIGKIETAPLKLAAAKALGLKEAKALVGKATMYDVAKAAWRPYLREIGMENVEELVDNGVQTLNNQVFNTMTGSKLDTSTSVEEIGETIVMTTLATAIAGGGDVMRNSRGEMYRNALNAAVQNPEAYNKVLAQLRDGGVISDADVSTQQQRIARLAEVNASLPATMSDEKRQEVIALEDQRTEILANVGPTEGQKKAAKAAVAAIDSKIASAVKNPEDPEPAATENVADDPIIAEDVVMAAPDSVTPITEDVITATPTVVFSATVAPPAVVNESLTTEITDPLLAQFNGDRAAPADVNPFDSFPTEDRLGENRIIQSDERAAENIPELAAIAPDRTASVAQVQQSYPGEVGALALVDDATNLALNTMMPAQRREIEANPGILSSLQTFMEDNLADPEYGDRSFRDRVEALGAEFVETSMGTKQETRLSRRLQPATVEDHVAIAFAEGVRVRPQDLQGNIAEGKDGGVRLKYTSRNGTPVDLLAQDILASMGNDGEAAVGMNEQDVINAIYDFINSNPDGPGDYMRDTIATREQGQMMAEPGTDTEISDADVRDAVDVESQLSEAEEAELEAFIASYDGDVEQLLNDWENWDPFSPTTVSMERINDLSPNIINVLDGKLNAIRETDPGTQQNIRGSETPVPENGTGAIESDTQPSPVNAENVEEAPARGPETIRPVEDGVERIPTPVVAINADGSAVVSNAVAFADLLAEAGGVYNSGAGGWTFPADRIDDMNVALSSRRTDGGSFERMVAAGVESSGVSGTVTAQVSTPGAIVKRNKTNAKLAAAKTFRDRLAIAQSQHGIDRARDERAVRRMVKRLQEAFPNIEIVVDVETVDRVKKELGITGPVMGFKYAGKTYVDPRYARPDTPGHEIGHLWLEDLAARNPAAHARGVELAMESPLFQVIKTTPAYAHLKTDAEIADEVLATAIGEKAALVGDTGLVLRFQRWLSDLWSEMGRAFGFQPRFMTLGEFADHQAAAMLKGGEIMSETQRRIKQLEDQVKIFPASVMLESHNAAVEMEKRGIDDDRIFFATGWRRGSDGLWRWSVDSKTFSFKVDENSDVPDNATVADVLDWPGLFAAYPEIADLPALSTDQSIIAAIQGAIMEIEGVTGVAAAPVPGLTDLAPEDAVVIAGDASAMPPPKFQVDAAASDYFARALTAREVIAAELKQDGLKDMMAKTAALADSMNLDVDHVRRLWELEAERAAVGRLVLSTKDLEGTEETVKERLVRQFRIKNQRRMGWLKQKFSTIKNLPRAIFERDEKRLGAIAAKLKTGTYLMEDLEAGMKEVYGAKISEAQWRHVDNVMRGEGDWGTLPVAIRAPAIQMRRLMDSVSRDLVLAGVMDGEVMLTVLGNSGVPVKKETLENWNGVNVYKALGKLPFERTDAENDAIGKFLIGNQKKLGTYFYRSYQITDDPENWKDRVDPRTKAEARRALERMIGEEIAKVQQQKDDKADVLEGKMQEVQAEINTMLDGLDAEITAIEARVKGLNEQQAAALQEKGVRNKNIDRSLGAAAKALRVLEKRARDAKRLSLDDAEALEALEDPDFQKLSMVAKQIVRRRRDIMKLQDRIEAAANFKPEYLAELHHRLQNVDVIIAKILEKEGPPAGQLTRSKLGAKDLNILKARQDIPQEIRDLMGEYHDPRINFAKSMFRAVNLLENQNFLAELRENFAGIYFIPPKELRPGFTSELSSEGSEAMAPLNGWQTTPEIKRALDNYFSPTARATDLTGKLFEKYMSAVASIKYGKTILSIDTHARNFFGNTVFVINNGYNPFEKKSLLAFKDVWSRITDQQQRDYMTRLTELRVVGNSSHLGTIKDLLEQMNGDYVDRMLERRGMTGSQKVKKTIEETYGAEDDFYKIMAFETEKKRYAKAWYGQPFESLPRDQREAVENHAAGLVRDLMPTYSMIPELVKDLNKIPLIATFVAFQAEMFRVTWNQYKQIGKDLNDPRTRGIGMTRMVGTAIAQAGLVTAVTAVGHLLSGIDWEADEAARRFMFPWQQKGALLYTDYEPGKEIRFVNTSYTNPYAFETKPLAALFLNWGKTWPDKMGEAAWTFFEPFLSPELTANTLGQLVYNTNERTGLHVYNPGRGILGDKMNVAKFLGWNLQPGVTKKALDMYSAISGDAIGGRNPKRVEDVLLGTFGLQIERMDVEKVISSNFNRMAKAKQHARNVFIENKNGEKDDPEGLKQLFEEATLDYNNALKQTGSSVSAAKAIGASPGLIYRILKDRGFSEAERAAIINGTEIVPKFEGYNK